MKTSKAPLSAALQTFVCLNSHIFCSTTNTHYHSSKPKSLTPAAIAILALALHLVAGVGHPTHLLTVDIVTIMALLEDTLHAGTTIMDIAAAHLRDIMVILMVRHPEVRTARRHEALHPWTSISLLEAVGEDTDHAEAIPTARRLGGETTRINMEGQMDMSIEGREVHREGMLGDTRGEGVIGE